MASQGSAGGDNATMTTEHTVKTNHEHQDNETCRQQPRESTNLVDQTKDMTEPRQRKSLINVWSKMFQAGTRLLSSGPYQ